MTCIVGLVEEGTVYIGGDSAGVSGLDLTVRADEKVFRSGPFLMGFTSSFRMGQLLRYALTPPLHDPEMDIDKYMVTVFVNAVRQCLKDGGYARKEHEVESGGTFLVGYKGRLFEINGDYQVGRPLDGYAAVGCGAQIAHGALFASAERPPEKRVLMALDAAERFSAGVRRPFMVEVLEP
ncbi:MAG: hypothetical protein V2A73_16980 [Pseudomonadota bacterium]